MPRITSRQHPLVRQCRALAARRTPAPQVLLDGEHLVVEALANGVRLEALISDGLDRAVVRDAVRLGVPTYDAPAPVLEAASPARTPSGVVAIAAWTPVEVAAVFAGAETIAVALLGVQDPGNVGGVIRTIDALGGSGAVACEGTASPAGWKALRGAMGSTFRVPVAEATGTRTIALARAAGARVLATVPHGAAALDAIDLTPPFLLLAGSEGAGLPEDAVRDADAALTVPMRAGVNSLNVGVTVALILWEAARRRATRSVTSGAR